MKLTEIIELKPFGNCPFCGSIMTGIEGSRHCSNVSCFSYETTKDNYDIPLSERKDIKKIKVIRNEKTI